MKVTFITNIAPLYRQALWQKLLNSSLFTTNFAYGKNNQGIKPFDLENGSFINLKNYWFKNRILVWQSGSISIAFKSDSDIFIFLIDPYCISNWISIFVCLLRRKKVIFWGHGLYGNESFFKKIIKLLFIRLAHHILLYNERGMDILLNLGVSSNKVDVVYNSLDYNKQIVLKDELMLSKSNNVYISSIKKLLFVGRITKVKKLDLLIRALKELNNGKDTYLLTVIGDGPELNNLKFLADKYSISKLINFIGECYDEKIISKYIFDSDLCVSPGNVGLTSIHSLTFGTPVCTHNNFNEQMPEFESICPGRTGFFFIENDLSDLVLKIRNWFDQVNYDRDKIRMTCYKVIDEKYNPDFQFKVFYKSFNKVLGK